MILRTPDKKALWSEIVMTIEEQLSSGLFYILLDRCYLDNLENGKAVIVADTRALQIALEQKALPVLKKAIQEVTGQAVQIMIVVGRSRIVEKVWKSSDMAFVPYGDSDEQELAILHERHGDIMGIVSGHFVFRQACTAIEKGGWGIFPQLLTEACKDYGVMAVLNGLRYVANQPKVSNPRAFFFKALKKGQFGYRLAVSAPTVGRVAR